jgi:hypothetical protein
MARNEFICWVEDAKLQMTRERRIRRTQEELEEGQRRPCCWPGCSQPRTHRQVAIGRVRNTRSVRMSLFGQAPIPGGVEGTYVLWSVTDDKPDVIVNGQRARVHPPPVVATPPSVGRSIRAWSGAVGHPAPGGKLALSSSGRRPPLGAITEARRSPDPSQGLRPQSLGALHAPGAFAIGRVSSDPRHRGGGHRRGVAIRRISARRGCGHGDGRARPPVRRWLRRVHVPARIPGPEHQDDAPVGDAGRCP